MGYCDIHELFGPTWIRPLLVYFAAVHSPGESQAFRDPQPTGFAVSRAWVPAGYRHSYPSGRQEINTVSHNHKPPAELPAWSALLPTGKPRFRSAGTADGW